MWLNLFCYKNWCVQLGSRTVTATWSCPGWQHHCPPCKHVSVQQHHCCPWQHEGVQHGSITVIHDSMKVSRMAASLSSMTGCGSITVIHGMQGCPAWQHEYDPWQCPCQHVAAPDDSKQVSPHVGTKLTKKVTTLDTNHGPDSKKKALLCWCRSQPRHWRSCRSWHGRRVRNPGSCRCRRRSRRRPRCRRRSRPRVHCGERSHGSKKEWTTDDITGQDSVPNS